MTQAAGGIADRAGKQPIIKTIAASTDKTNQALSSVLEKNNFLKIGQSENLNNWALRFHTGDAL